MHARRSITAIIVIRAPVAKESGRVFVKMKLAICFVLCVVGLSVADVDTFRAAIVQDVSRNSDINGYIPAVYEAGKSNVDILVLPSSDTLNTEYNYDETVKNLSTASREASVYLVAHLHEPVRCSNNNQMVRTNVVFNREGTVVSMYRKLSSTVANCSINDDGSTFTTDFGVTFALFMEEDLALKDPRTMPVKNFVLAGSWPTEIPFLSAGQFASPWSYVNEANVLSDAGIYPQTEVEHGERLLIVDLDKNGRTDVSNPPVMIPSTRAYPGEDLSQYSIRPLDLEATRQGYEQTVCHNEFCCQFFVQADFKGSKSELNYSLAAFEGVRHFGKNRYIGTQSCAVVCTGHGNTPCDNEDQSNTEVIFNKITISGNFSQDSIQYPMIYSTGSIDKFSMDTIDRQVSINVEHGSILSAGIFGRDFAKDHEVEERDLYSEIYGFLASDDVQEFLDYLWIRLRILIFVVSIYILEMM